MSEILLQEVNELTYTINELNEDGQPKKLKLNGIFGKYGTVNGNRRNYSRAVMESAVGSVMPLITERRMIGELDHPEDAKPHLKNASHLVTKLELKENGEVYGEAEVLPTASGKILEALLKSGVKLGISSRGFGSTKLVNGIQEVQDDYKLVTFDIVSDPSAPGAFPKAVYEQKENQNEEKEFSTNLGTLLEEVLEKEISITQEKKEFVTMDEDSNRFYMVEGEKESYGNLNFHISHKYHILVKNEDFIETVGINDTNLQLIEDIYGTKVIEKIRSKITQKGYDPETLNIQKGGNS